MKGTAMLLSLVPDRANSLLMLLLALVLDVILAGFPLAHPVLALPTRELARAVAWADRRLNRIEREDSVRRARGLLLLLVMSAAAALLALGIAMLAHELRLAWLGEMLLIAGGLGLGRGIVMARDIQAGIHKAVEAAAARKKAGPPPPDAAAPAPPEDAIRQAVMAYTHKAVWDMDLHGVMRTALEALTGQFARGVVAPLFWLLALDLPGLAVWMTVRAIAGVIGHRTPRYRDFGAAARDAVDILDWLPSRLSVLLLAAACLCIPGTRPQAALGALKQGRGHAEGTTALPIAALAEALGLSLAGPRREGEVMIKEGWLGAGRARVTTGDLKPALALLATASLLAVAVALLVDVVVA